MSQHPYGPHRPEDAPQTVEYWPPGAVDPVDLPIRPELVEQRSQLNAAAHKRAGGNTQAQLNARYEADAIAAAQLLPEHAPHRFVPVPDGTLYGKTRYRNRCSCGKRQTSTTREASA